MNNFDDGISRGGHANFFKNRNSQIRKFVRYASPQIRKFLWLIRKNQNTALVCLEKVLKVVFLNDCLNDF